MKKVSMKLITVIVHGADTDHFDSAKQSAGLSYNYKNDFEMLKIGMKIYDALYSWAKYVSDERHTWNPDLKVG